MESILTSIKTLLGIESDYTHFDNEIIMYINSVFMILNQLGVGPEECFAITGNTQTWNDFSVSISDFQLVKTYIYLKVKKQFDPPLSGTASNSMDELIREFEWRLNVQVDPGKESQNA